MRFLKLTMLYLVVALAISGCSKTMMSAYGIKKPRPINKDAIIQYAMKNNLPLADCYEIDTGYESFIRSFDTAQFRLQKKNHFQPLQALYFNRSGKLESFQINCYAGGFPNLAWERDSILTTFPPKQQAPLDNILDLQTQLKYLKPLSGFPKDPLADYDYVVVVYWNHFMFRQTDRFLKFIKANASLAAGLNIKVIYANNDNLYD